MLKFRPILCLLIAQIWFFASVVQADTHQERVLLLDNTLTSIELVDYTLYYEDKSGRQTIETIKRKKSDFQPVNRHHGALGYTKNSVWLKLSVNNTEPFPVEWLLEYTYPLIDYITLYYPLPTEPLRYQTIENGDHYPFDKRDIENRAFAFKMNSPPGKQTIYLKLKASGTIYTDLVAWNKQTFFEQTSHTLAMHWFFCGMLFALGCYHFFIFIMVRESSYLYLTGFTFSMMMFTLIHKGLAFQYLWPNTVYWANLSHPFFLALSCLMGISFSRVFLNADLNCPIFSKALQIASVLSFFVIGLVFVVDYYYLTQLTVALAVMTVTLMLTGGITLCFFRMKSAFFYTGATFTLVFGCVFTALNVYGITDESFISMWSTQIGSALLVLLLSFGVGDKINTMQSEKEKMLKALREANEKYKTLVENANDGIVVRVHDKPVYANRAVFKISGYDGSEFYTKKMMFFFPDTPRGKQLIRERINQINEGLTPPGKYETQIRKKNGEVIDVIISDTPIHIDGENGTLSIITDISDRVKAEAKIQEQKNELRAHRDNLEKTVRKRTEELEKLNITLKRAKTSADLAAKEAQAANTAKSTFLANMSHEIRTPLNAVIGMGELVLSTTLTKKQQEYLEILYSSARSLLQLINDILDFSKMDAGKLDFEYTPFRLGEVIDAVTDMFIDKSITKEIELIVDIDEDVPQELISDPFRLRQVLANLTSNAFKFTKQGEITLSVSKKNETPEGVVLRFCVKDTGIGIPQDTLEFLFNAFQQADDSTTRKYGGTGLGLAICKSIAELMDGDIWADSKPGQGSSFYFTAFFKHGYQLRGRPQTDMPPPLKNKLVLIVDDNASTLMVLKRYIESFGFTTQLTNSGESAVAIFENMSGGEQVGLIIMDNRLPGMDGVTAAEKIRNLPLKIPPIIIISAYGSASEIARAKQAGLNHFLAKPIKQSQLFNTVIDVFGFNPEQAGRPDFNESDSMIRNLKILLVEDNAVNQMVAEEILASAGIETDIVSDGHQAIKALKSNQYDLVLMDVQMPEMDGIEATLIIRNDLKMSSLPIIAMTAHAMYGDKEKCLSAGMNDYISKPIERGELFEIIKKNISIKNNLSSLTNSKTASLSYAVAGIDIEDGLKRFDNSWDIYNGILQKFTETFQGFAAEFRNTFSSGDYTTSRLKAHSLKGAAANISAKDTALAARALENACIEEDVETITKAIPAVEDYLNVVFNSIKKVSFPEEKEKRSEKPLKADELVFEEEDIKYELTNIILSLETSINHADPVSIDKYFVQLKKKLPGVFFQEHRDLMEELEKFIILYKFDEALETLKELSVLFKNDYN